MMVEELNGAKHLIARCTNPPTVSIGDYEKYDGFFDVYRIVRFFDLGDSLHPLRQRYGYNLERVSPFMATCVRFGIKTNRIGGLINE